LVLMGGSSCSQPATVRYRQLQSVSHTCCCLALEVWRQQSRPAVMPVHSLLCSNHTTARSPTSHLLTSTSNSSSNSSDDDSVKQCQVSNTLLLSSPLLCSPLLPPITTQLAKIQTAAQHLDGGTTRVVQVTRMASSRRLTTPCVYVPARDIVLTVLPLSLLLWCGAAEERGEEREAPRTW